MLNVLNNTHIQMFAKDRRHSSPSLLSADFHADDLSDNVALLHCRKTSPGIARRIMGKKHEHVPQIQLPRQRGKSNSEDKSPNISQRLLGKLVSSPGSPRRSISPNLLEKPKAMSMPHGASSATDTSEKWMQDARNQIFPDKVDWTVHAVNGAHIWLDTEHSGCFVSQDCKKNGPRKRCAACKVVAHQKCIEQLERINQVKCRPTFREASPKGGIASYPPHHNVRRRKQEGRCDECGKAFSSMLQYKSQKDFVAYSCSWCKRAFHTKDCSKKYLLEKQCDLGEHGRLILPPSWIVKLPPRKYSQIGGKKGRQSTRRHSSKERRAFVIKPVENDIKIPLIVFVNPRSGGNQGARILEKYQYILNPRQVFDLTNGGPRFALELFRKVNNLRILVCGGDGTVGWILSEIDRLKINPPPAVSILPLGTGNDLARFLGWGAGYTDEPLGKILTHVAEGEAHKLDRWDIDVRANPNAPKETDSEENSVSRLPLSVMNNYYSLGADADVCLEFHESREANPERFNSRLKNLYFYGKKGSETIIKRKSKDLHKYIENLLCDGCDLTEKIRDLKPVCLIFLNISSYSAGTSPWGNPSSDEYLPQSCDDGYLEIIGLTSKSMVATQVGGHGIRIYQCQSAILTTTAKLPMQVDGEPCRLNPSKILIKRRNQANMIAKKKPHRSFYKNSTEAEVILPRQTTARLYYLTFLQYDTLVKYDIEEIKNVVEEICTLEVEPEWPLDEMRKRLEVLKTDQGIFKSRLADEWCFLDATWTARIYRIDEAQESLLYIADVMEGGGIFVLDLLKKPDLTTLVHPSPKPDRNANINFDDVRPPSANRSMSFDALSHNSNDGLASIYDDDEASSSESSITTEDDEEDFSSLSSSPRGLSSPSTPLSPEHQSHFELPADNAERSKVFLESARKGYLNKFRSIHDAGTSLTVCDTYGRTPLHIASKHGRKEIVEYITEKGPRCVIDLIDQEYGQTALHMAAQHKHRTVCTILISKGASVTRQDTEGNTPHLLALKSHDTELAKFLQTQERMQLIAADDHETAV